ncbi:MAG: LD-carboxypeptidase [bacterium]|nr:LD-carboxypeptidase [bacterium]
MKLRIPQKLKNGDTIAFISPSAGLAPFAMHRIEAAVSFFEGQGYKVKIGKHALKNDGYVSASIQERVDDIHAAFRDPEISCIITTIGGNHSNQLLQYIDWEMIKKNPKIFIGYSDVSVLHYGLQTQAELQTYYGPCVMTQFGENPEVFEYTWKSFNEVLVGEAETISVLASDFWTDDATKNWFEKEDLISARQKKQNSGYVWIREGTAQGYITGGCVPSINHLLGTKFWIDPKDSIFFIDIPEGHELVKGLSLSDLDSYFADLSNAGVFDVIRGLIVGRPYNYSEDEFKNMIEIIKRYTGHKKYPILANANIGHADPIITLPYGSEAILNSKNNSFTHTS